MNRLVTFSAAYAAYVWLLHNVDGPWRRWKKGDAIDMWTFTHVLWGVIGKRWGLTANEMVVLSVLNEAGEAWVRANRPDLLFGSPESNANVIVDVGVTMAAFAATPAKH